MSSPKHILKWTYIRCISTRYQLSWQHIPSPTKFNQHRDRKQLQRQKKIFQYANMHVFVILRLNDADKVQEEIQCKSKSVLSMR